MKSGLKILRVMVLLFLIMALPILPGCKLPEEVLVFHLTFDGQDVTEKLTDKVVQIKPDQQGGITESSFVEGIKPGSMAMNVPASSSNYVLCYKPPLPLPQSGTLEFWIRPHGAPGTYFYEKGRGSMSIYGYWEGGRLGFQYLGQNDSTETRIRLNEKQWHHIAFTWELLSTLGSEGTWRIRQYVDGYCDPDCPFCGSFSKMFNATIPATTDELFYLGCFLDDNDGLIKYLANGDIDELKVYAGVLSEDQIYAHFTELFPVEFYAKETVFKVNTSATTTIEIQNISDAAITGNVRCEIPEFSLSWQIGSLTIPAGGKTTISPDFTLPNVGEYDLECCFIRDGVAPSYDRTIKLFAIDGEPRPARDNLYLKPILSIDCVTNVETNYTQWSETYTPTNLGLVKGVKIQEQATAEYCDTEGTTTPDNQYRQSSGLSGPFGVHITWCLPNEDHPYDSLNDIPANAMGQQQVGPSSFVEHSGYLFDNIPAGATITYIVAGLGATIPPGCSGTVTVALSWNGGTDWTEESYEWKVDNQGTADRWDHSWLLYPADNDFLWGRNWTSAELSSDNFKVKVTNSCNKALTLSWCAIMVNYNYMYSRFAYLFQVQNPQNPHLIMVTYPDDALRTMAIVVSTDKPWNNTPVIETGVFTGGDEYPNTNGFAQHTMLFWPIQDAYGSYASDFMITFANELRGSAGAAAKEIAVYEIEGDETSGWFPKTEVILAPDGGRMLGLWWEDPGLRGFGDNRSASAMEGFYQVVLNAMDYLQFTGQNLLVYPIWFYDQPHYPSRVERNIATTELKVSEHPYPDDWFELLLKVAELNGVSVIPSLTIKRIPSLGAVWGDQIQPAEIESAVLATIDDILQQYGDYLSFKGISLNIWGETVNARLTDTVMKDLLTQANQKIQTARNDLKLIVSCWLPCDSIKIPYTGCMDWDLDDWLGNVTTGGDPEKSIRDMYMRANLDLDWLTAQDKGIAIERVLTFSYRDGVQSIEAAPSLWPIRQFFLGDPEGCYEPFIKPGNNAAAIYNPYWEGNVHDYGIQLQNGAWAGNYEGSQAITIIPGGKYFMENYMLVMTKLDPVQIGNGGFMVGTVGHEYQVRDFSKAYCALPAASFEDVPCTRGVTSTLNLGLARQHDRYFYIINKTSEDIVASLKFLPETATSVSITDLTTGVSQQVDRNWQVNLGPFELKSFRFDSATDTLDSVCFDILLVPVS